MFIAAQLVHFSRSIVFIVSPASKRFKFQTDRRPLAMDMMAAVWRPETWNSGLVTYRHVGGAAGVSAGAGGASIRLRKPPMVVREIRATTLRWV